MQTHWSQLNCERELALELGAVDQTLAKYPSSGLAKSQAKPYQVKALLVSWSVKIICIAYYALH